MPKTIRQALENAAFRGELLSIEELRTIRENEMQRGKRGGLFARWRDASTGNTLLLEAIANGHAEAARQFIDLVDLCSTPASRFILSACDYNEANGNSPLMLAIKTGQRALALLLIEHLSADELNVPDADEVFPIHMAAMLRDEVILQALIAKGADTQVTTSSEVKGAVLPMEFTPLQLYERDITEEDLAYPQRLSPRAPDRPETAFTRNPLFSSLHWHSLALCRNLEIPCDPPVSG